MSNRKPALATRLAQALRYLDAETGAVIPPIQPVATYARDGDYAVRKPYWYRRDGNETTAHAEAIMASLEDAAESLLFSSEKHCFSGRSGVLVTFSDLIENFAVLSNGILGWCVEKLLSNYFPILKHTFIFLY